MFNDKNLECCGCRNEFLFSGAEQEFFAMKGLKNEPKRCPDCRLVARIERSGGDTGTVTNATCATCGHATRVPFQPKGHRPILCLSCLHTNRDAAQKEPTLAIVS
ncbi:MAG: zinc-ribbon domain-containing protein [Candidatus Obscuribacterales bacterium]|nr:zinc-ribbon domain-containing protein [Candidatus Obscuribacterales bacterium]